MTAKKAQGHFFFQEVSFSRLNSTLCLKATPTFDSSIELCMGHVLREPVVGIVTSPASSSSKLKLRKVVHQTFTGADPVGLRVSSLFRAFIEAQF